MARAARVFLVVGLIVAVSGLAIALALNDRYLGLAIVIAGAFLMFLPYTRPDLGDDE